MRISENKRYILNDDGKPFFYLADTTWRMFYNTDHQMAERYMQKRKAQGFTVFMPVVIGEVHAGENETSQFGQYALIDWDPTRPNEEFFLFVDWVVRRAAELGLVVGMLPTWGEYVGPIAWGRIKKTCFTVENAFVYGEFLGNRYRNDPNIIWVVGGDRNPEEDSHVEIWRSMAAGLRKGDGGKHLITYHPSPRDDLDRFSSGDWLPDETWIDFNMMQTGTTIDRPNYLYIQRDYQRTGIQKKPTLDGECRYEYSHEAFYNKPPTGRRINAHQVRKAMYNAMLSGAAGHTYGCRCVWNFYHEGTEKTRDTDLDWTKALDLEGAWQLRHMRNLLEEAYPFYRLVPDFEGKVVVYGQGRGGTYVPAAVSEDRDFLLAYLPEAMPIHVDLGVLRGPARLKWYDVRTGAYITLSEEGLTGIQRIEPIERTGAPDFVLVAEVV